MSTTTIQLRIDSAMKTKAQKLFKELGLDLSSAMKMFLTKALATNSIPFEIRTVNGLTPAREREILKEAEWTIKHAKRYTDTKKMIADMLA